MIVAFLNGFFWHPLHGDGYQFWSGIAGSFLTSLPSWLIAALLFLRHRNCHVRGCWRISWHTHPDHGHLVCKRHHPRGGGIEADEGSSLS